MGGLRLVSVPSAPCTGHQRTKELETTIGTETVSCWGGVSVVPAEEQSGRIFRQSFSLHPIPPQTLGTLAGTEQTGLVDTETPGIQLDSRWSMGNTRS